MLVIIAWLVLLPQRWTLMKPFVVSSCSWFVFPFSFLKSWERTDVGFSTILTIIITFIWEGRQLLTCYHCSSTYVNRNPSMPGAAWGGVWQECLSPGSSQHSPCKNRLQERHMKSPCVGHCERLDLGKANPFSQISSHSMSLLSLAKANQPPNNAKKLFCESTKEPCFEAIKVLFF